MQENKILFVVVFILLFFYSGASQNKCQKKNCVVLLTIILSLFSGLRSWYIGDCIHYCNVFVACNVPGWNITVNNTDTIGLQCLFRIAGQLGIGFEGCLLIIAVFIAISLGIVVYKYSSSVYWSYLIYLAMGFYMFSLSGLKQSIAMGFCMLAIMAVFENKPLRFVLLVVLASLFHIPAIAFIVVYPFAHKKIDVWYFFLLAIMIAGVFLYRDEIVAWAAQIYYENELTFQAAESIGGRFMMMLLIMGVSLFLRPLKNKDVRYREVFNVMVLAAIVQSFSVYDNVFTRFADYFYQFVVLFFPMMMQSGDDQVLEQPERRYQIRYFTKESYQLIGAGITLFAIVFYWRYIEQSGSLLSNFHFFWQVDDVPSSMELLQRSIQQWGK